MDSEPRLLEEVGVLYLTNLKSTVSAIDSSSEYHAPRQLFSLWLFF